METQVFGFDTALHRLGGDLPLFQDLATYFLEDGPELLATIRSSIARGDVKAAYRAAHSLRSLIANFDAKDAMASAQSVELLLAKSDLQKAQNALAHLESDVEPLCQALHSFTSRPQ